MTFAWYGHLKTMNTKPWLLAALASWGIALFEYLLQVPANRIGYTVMNVGQLKTLQEIITLSVFVPFAYYYLRDPMKLDYLWASLCMLGAVFSCSRESWRAYDVADREPSAHAILNLLPICKSRDLCALPLFIAISTSPLAFSYQNACPAGTAAKISAC